jgi:RNA polymerase sigma factor (sigma-70 family)
MFSPPPYPSRNAAGTFAEENEWTWEPMTGDMGNTYADSLTEDGALEDDMLIERARGGDIPAFETLVERYQALAFRSALLVTRETGAAEDAAQEAFLRAFRALPRFRAGSPFRPWLLRIVGNEARRRQASNVRQQNLAAQASYVIPFTTERSVEAQVLDVELRTRLHAAIEALPETDQLVIAYRFVLGLSESEMAAAMNCRRGTVKSRLSRALDRLRSRLGIHEPELLARTVDA